MKCIYKISIKDHNYVGSTKNFRKRKNVHLNQLRHNKHHNRFLQNCYNKYGEDSLVFSIIEEIDDQSILLEREQYHIDATKPDMNIGHVGGGDNFSTLPEEEKKRIRKTQSDKSKEWWDSVDRGEYSQKITGEGNPNYGNSWSEEQKRHLSKKLKALYEKEPWRKDAIAERTKSMFENATEEWMEQFSEARRAATIGEKNPFYGKTHSQETIDKINKTKENKILEVGHNEYYKHLMEPVIIRGIEYSSIREASKILCENMSTLYSRLTSSAFFEYRYKNNPDGYADSVNDFVIVTKETDPVGFYYPTRQRAADDFGCHRETILRFTKKGVPEKSKYAGYTFTKHQIVINLRTHDKWGFDCSC